MVYVLHNTNHVPSISCHVQPSTRNSFEKSSYFPRLQVLGWLEEKLPAEKNLPSGLTTIVAPLFSCLEDRSGDVRKKGQAVVPILMQHVGWDAMSKQANKLKVHCKWFVQFVVAVLVLEGKQFQKCTHLTCFSCLAFCSNNSSRSPSTTSKLYRNNLDRVF